MSRPDLAPKIAEYLAEFALTATTNQLSVLPTGHGAKVWLEMVERFPEATWEEMARGTLIALELMAVRSDEIAADTEALKKKLRP